MQLSQDDRISPQKKTANTSGVTILAIITIVLVCAAAYFYLGKENTTEPQEITPVVLPDPLPAQPLETGANLPEPEPAPIAEPAAQAVTPVEAKAEPLPALSDSDAFIQEKAIAVAAGMNIAPQLIKSNILRQFVVFVDNLAQGELATKFSPLKAPTTKFSTSEITNKTYIDPDSYHRYDLYADLLIGLNEQKLAKTYQTIAPLLEEAFAELGYGDVSFNTRMLQAVDVLLATPIIERPIELDGISVNYQFVDPKLEALPNAQKLLIRMGPENTRKVKTALHKLKQLLLQA